MKTETTTMNDPAVVPAEICVALRDAHSIALMGHVTPDADALASMGALWLALPELGIYPHLVLPEGTVSRQLQYLVRYAGLRHCACEDLQDCDLIVALDTAKEKRLNDNDHLGILTNIPIINIDHHTTNTEFGRWNWIVPQASSTSELVYGVLRELGCQITPTIATLLYAGIHTDTQGFSLSNTDPHSLRVGHELALAGAQIPEVCERMHRSRSRGEFELLSVVYRNTRVSDDGRLSWSTVTHEEIQLTGCQASDIDDQVEVPRSIEGILVAILFSEGEPGKIRMNFRGERGVSVLDLAGQFGGGGHHASAGARQRGTMEEITNRVLPAALEFVAGLEMEAKIDDCP
ncbi:MAG: bifunctional oligoribonuclease/PAP phosphatase NrnA [Phycisphaerae bacterium]|nr:bifunctional oligoribonuclease/PAP phosphatase NrnA [Phycisphaerae bacterium]